MKKVLFGTTAIAAAMSAGVAFADGHATGVQLSGFSSWAFYGTSVDAGNAAAVQALETDGFSQYTEVHFRAAHTTEAMGGLEIGARGELRVDADAAVTVDEQWVFVDGSFGQIAIGENDGAAANLGVVAGFAGGMGGYGGLLGDANLGDTTGLGGMTNDSAKIAYTTPRLGGLVQLSASYTPDTNDAGFSQGFGTGTAVEDIVELGVNLVTEVSGASISVGGGLSDGENQSGTTAQVVSQYGVGATVSMAGFGIGGSLLNQEVDNGGTDRDNWEVSAEYDATTWSVGVTYAEREVGTTEQEYVAVSGMFALSDKASITGGHVETDTNTVNTDRSHTWVALNVSF